MTESNAPQLDPAIVAELYIRHGDELRAFLTGVLRSAHLASDVMQTAFVRTIEKGHMADEGSLKSWLFQVAFREALVVRRRQATHDRAIEKIASDDSARSVLPEVLVSRQETVVALRQAIQSLPAAQRHVLKMRMYEDLKFAEIARRLDTPLGTVLARMQAALKRLRKILGEETGEA